MSTVHAETSHEADVLRKLPFRVRDIMKQNPLTIPANTTIRTAAQAMDKHGYSCLLVEDKKRIVGIITERDIVRRVAARGSSLSRTMVREIMSSSIVDIPPDATVEEALKVMANNKIRRLPVVDEGRMLGLVALGDIAKALMDKAGYESALIDAIARQTNPREGVYE